MSEPSGPEEYTLSRGLVDAICEALEELPRRQTNQLFIVLEQEIRASMEAWQNTPKIIT